MSTAEVKSHVGAGLLEPHGGPVSAFRRAREVVEQDGRGRGRAEGRKWRLRLDGGRAAFYLIVLLPTLLTGLYLYAIASDQFISEAKFVVRSPQKPTGSGLTALLQSSGIGAAHDDTYVVIDYIKSRDALKEVDDKVHFRDIVSHSGGDFLARFPLPHQNESFESLYDYFSNVVTVVQDASTSISTLKVRLLTASDSKKVADALLDASEALVNRLNMRSLGDSVGLAQREVAKAEQRTIDAQNALTAYRISVGLVDNTSTAKAALELIGGLDRELVTMRTQLAQTLQASPNSPSLQPLRDRVFALEGQIANQRAKLVGRDGSLVGTFAEFERLTLEAEFASKAQVVAATMLETSKMEALRKQLYLERVVEPNAADYSRYPRRLLVLVSVFGTSLLAFGVLWLLVVNAREHAS